MKSKGFTIVELLGAITVLAILMVVATTAVASMMNKQKNSLNSMAEENVDDAAISYFVGKKKVYMPPCKTGSGGSVTFTQAQVDEFNKNNASGFDETDVANNRTNFSGASSVADKACINFVTVKTLIDEGLLEDSSGACKKDSIILVYKKYNKESDGMGGYDEHSEEVAVHEKGICG